MAVVFLAEDLKHRRRVALKVLRPEVARSLGSGRFLREIEIAAQLSHPHILPLFDSGEVGKRGSGDDSFLFFVMPFVEGESLRDRLTRDKQLPLDDALRIAREVAGALTYAHDLGIIHRDIKPENILLQAGHPVVSDFGIASALHAAVDSKLTDPGFAVGTPAYMSPEQSVGESADPRSDVYSLGCVLYEMLAGTPPFTGATAQAIQARKVVDSVPRLRTVRESVPEGLEVVIRTALARVPADRYATVADFAAALAHPGLARAPARSVAVLPFLNLSAVPDNEYFADGITEDVIAQLSKVRSLKVISRTSVMMFKKREQSLKEIGAMLSAATLLEGSVRRVGDRVRIVAQLIDAETDQHLWAETYDRQLTDIFAIQSDVALQIATALRAELSPDEQTRIHREPTRDLQAYQLYLQGRHWFVRHTAEGLRQAVDYFKRAVQKDPGFALAHADLAQAYTELALASGGGALPPRSGVRPGPGVGVHGPRAGRRAGRGALHARIPPLRPGFRLGRRRSGVPARARVEPEQRGHQRPLRAHAGGPGAPRGGDPLRDPRPGTRPAVASDRPGGRAAPRGALRGGAARRGARGGARSGIRAGPRDARVGVPEARAGRGGPRRASAGGRTHAERRDVPRPAGRGVRPDGHGRQKRATCCGGSRSGRTRNT